MTDQEKLSVSKDQAAKIEAYKDQEVRKALEKQRQELGAGLERRAADAERSSRSMQAGLRRGEQHGVALEVANEVSPELPRLLKMLFRKLHREFLTIDTYEEYSNEPKRNWPLIVGVTATLFGGYLFFSHQTEFWDWERTGADGYILGAFAILFVAVFIYWRNREERRAQTRQG